MQRIYSILSLGAVRGESPAGAAAGESRDDRRSLNVWVQLVLLAVAIAVLVNILFGLLIPS